MSDFGIIMSAPMMIALLDGRKTMTRRLAWNSWYATANTPQNKEHANKWGWRWRDVADPVYLEMSKPSRWQKAKPGDRLWVRETCEAQTYQALTSRRAIYSADAKPVEPLEPWDYRHQTRPAIHMPRIDSRICIVLDTVRVEPLQKITEADCVAEGAPIDGKPSQIDGGVMVRDASRPHVTMTPRTWYRELWDRLHGAGAWDVNPDVVVLGGAVHQCNIDAVPSDIKSVSP